MAKTWYKLFYHVTWSTYLRTPIITPEIECVLFPYLESKAAQNGCHIYGCNSIEDHVHIAIRIPPRYSVSEIIGILKGASSHFLNNEIRLTTDFAWQTGFGAVTVSETILPKVLKYISQQKEHYRHHTTLSSFELPEGEVKTIESIQERTDGPEHAKGGSPPFTS